MSKVDRFKQEEIKTFSLPRNDVKVVGQADPVQSSEIHFPGYEPVKAQQKAHLLQQEELHITGRVEVGSKTFNINDLIKKGLFDAAEYFLGRPLTPIERLEGLMSQEELRKVQEAEKKKETEKNVLEALSKLVDNTAAKLPAAPPAVEPKEKKDDDDDFEVDFDEDPFWDRATKNEFIQSYGEEEFQRMLQKEISEWSEEDKSKYFESLNKSQHRSAPSQSPSMTLEELEEEEEKEQEQVGRLREMKDVLPEYELNHRYTIAQATQMLKNWRERYSELAPLPGTRPLDKPLLFQAQPNSEWQKRLSDIARI